MTDNTDYNIFFEFIRNYSGRGFMGINNLAPIMVRLNWMLSSRRQFFCIADLTKLQLIYTSPQVLDIFGLKPEKFDHPSQKTRINSN